MFQLTTDLTTRLHYVIFSLLNLAIVNNKPVYIIKLYSVEVLKITFNDPCWTYYRDRREVLALFDTSSKAIRYSLRSMIDYEQLLNLRRYCLSRLEKRLCIIDDFIYFEMLKKTTPSICFLSLCVHIIIIVAFMSLPKDF